MTTMMLSKLKKSLIKKNIIISAAADGIGWSIAKLCLEEGANVFISDINDKKIAKIKKHKKYNKSLFISKINASNHDEVKKYFLDLRKKIKTIDALVNNIGIAGPTGELQYLKINEWSETINTNINSHFFYSKYAIPMFNKNGGSIINLSSTAGIFGFPLRTPYAVTKWALIGLTKSLAMELGKKNIRVNAICPGSVSGQRMNKVIKAKSDTLGIKIDKIQKDYESMVSLKTFVNKEDIANIAIFLLSNSASKISGQVMTVDGNTERMN